MLREPCLEVLGAPFHVGGDGQGQARLHCEVVVVYIHGGNDGEDVLDTGEQGCEAQKRVLHALRVPEDRGDGLLVRVKKLVGLQ